MLSLNSNSKLFTAYASLSTKDLTSKYYADH